MTNTDVSELISTHNHTAKGLVHLVQNIDNKCVKHGVPIYHGKVLLWYVPLVMT